MVGERIAIRTPNCYHRCDSQKEMERILAGLKDRGYFRKIEGGVEQRSEGWGLRLFTYIVAEGYHKVSLTYFKAFPGRPGSHMHLKAWSTTADPDTLNALCNDIYESTLKRPSRFESQTI